MIAATMKTIIVPHGTANGHALDRLVEELGKAEAERDPERGTDQRRDHSLVPDHPPRLAARHADRAQHPDLAGALEHRQDERVHDPEQADDDREPEQDVEQDQELVQPGLLVLDELLLGLDLRVGEGLQDGFVSFAVFAGVDATRDVHEGEDVLRVRVDRVERLRGDGHRAERRAARAEGRRSR